MSRAAPRFRRTNANLPAIPGNNSVIQVSLIGSVEGQMTINTFYYAAVAGPLVFNDLINASTGWRAAFLTTYLAAVSADWTLTATLAQCLTQPSLQVEYDTTSAGTAGTGPPGHMPTTTAVCLSRVSNVKGQHGRGRIFMPAVPASWVASSSVFLAAGITAYNNMATSLGTGYTISTIAYAAQIVQRSKTSPRPAIGIAPVTATAFRKLTATVRRRRVGRGK